MPGRPKPQIIMSTPDPKNKNIDIQVIQVDTYYIVVYDDQPVNIIKVNTSQHLWTNTKHYVKTGYANRAHALGRSRRLNELFKTDKFTVKELK